MTREITEITSEEQWHALRNQDVTSTGSASLFGLSPYLTQFELYHSHKSGIPLPFEVTERMEKGKRMEQYAAQEVADKLEAVNVRPLNVYARIPGERFGSSFDYELEFSCGEKVLLEIKAVDFFRHKNTWVENEAPEHIEIQLQHQLEAIDRYDRGIIAAFTSIYDFTPYERARDREMGKALRSAVKKFWHDMDNNTEPKPDFARDGDMIAELYKGAAGEAVDMTDDDEFNALLAKYERVKKSAAESKAEQDALKTEIHFKLGNKGGAFTKGYKINTGWTAGSAGTMITSDMVGTVINARKPYRKCLITDLT